MLPLDAPLAFIQTDFLSHLDPDGISELAMMDRTLCSTLYHTWPSFKNAVIRHLDIGVNQLLPAGIMALPDILTQLRGMTVDARRFFFENICAYGPKDALEPFIESGADLLVPPLTLREAFMNENTFLSLARASIHFNTMDMLIGVLSSRFILERSHDSYSVQNILRLWSPDPGSRERALANFLVGIILLDTRIDFEDDHKRVCNTLIKQGYCSSRIPDRILGLELAWVVCQSISHRGYRAHVRRSEKNRTNVLSNLIHHYKPSIDTEVSEFPHSYAPDWLDLPELMQYPLLMLAVTAGDLPVVELLVTAGANITKTYSPKQLSAWDLAVRNLSFDHPRNWAEVPPSKAHDHYLVSEEVDIAIYQSLLQNTNQPRLIALEEQVEQGLSREFFPWRMCMPILIFPQS